MSDLTVGQVAGIINGAVIVAQVTLPLAVVCVLAGILKDSNNAVTWSVVGGILNASSWPTILRTDTAATTRVDKRVMLISISLTAGLILLAAVGIITPLGLYENISHGSYEEVEFGYVPDLQPIGKGTPERADYNVSRLCGFKPLIDCPGQYHGGFNYTDVVDVYSRSEDDNAWISSIVPSNLTEIFSSGSKGDRSLVAGAFDIEYRSFFQASDLPAMFGYDEHTKPNIDDGRKRTQATFRMYESLISEEQVRIVEGLVVNANVGGIGFRNHTVPINPEKRSEWTESLLWIQPETVCVSTNLSIEYTISGDPSRRMTVLVTDRGGFFHLTKNSSFINLDDAQNRPELFARAHAGATCNNSNFMKLMRVSRNETALGKSYKVYTTNQRPNGVNIQPFTHLEGRALELIPGFALDEAGDMSFDLDAELCDADAASRGFRDGNLTAGLSNINNIAVSTGLILGAARRLNGGPDRLDSNSIWSAPFYSCATALKAQIMDVSFRINGTNSLINLDVTNMKPRTYSSHASLPLWAIENTEMSIEDVAPFWGIVDDKYESWPHLWTSRKDHLYLPVGSDPYSVGLSSISAAASAHAPHAALQEVYNDKAKFSMEDYNTPDDSLFNWFPDYSGRTDYRLFSKWQELSRSSDTAPIIVNLIWTDIMTNYVLGTKSTLSSGNGFANDSVNLTEKNNKGPMIRVLRYRRKVQYDWRYGIPGLVFLKFHVMAIFLALKMWLTGRVKFTYLRTLLNQTATGRCVTVERHGDAARAPTVGTRQWIQAYGEEDLGFRKAGPAEKRDGESERGGGATESPTPSVSEDEELLSIVEGEPPLEQEQTAHRDVVSTGNTACERKSIVLEI